MFYNNLDKCIVIYNLMRTKRNFLVVQNYGLAMNGGFVFIS